jgi:hypothetical protein
MRLKLLVGAVFDAYLLVPKFNLVDARSAR